MGNTDLCVVFRAGIIIVIMGFPWRLYRSWCKDLLREEGEEGDILVGGNLMWLVLLFSFCLCSHAFMI